MIVDSNRENFLGFVLTDDVSIQVLVDFLGRRGRFSLLLHIFAGGPALDGFLDGLFGVSLRQDDEKMMAFLALDESALYCSVSEKLYPFKRTLNRITYAF